eukprot:scaffold171953_cov17-Tisochrysis_lutea.AAC.1
MPSDPAVPLEYISTAHHFELAGTESFCLGICSVLALCLSALLIPHVRRLHIHLHVRKQQTLKQACEVP